MLKKKEAKKLLEDMKTDTNRTYLWDSAKDLDKKSADMTKPIVISRKSQKQCDIRILH